MDNMLHRMVGTFCKFKTFLSHSGPKFSVYRSLQFFETICYEKIVNFESCDDF